MNCEQVQQLREHIKSIEDLKDQSKTLSLASKKRLEQAIDLLYKTANHEDF